MVKVRFKTHAHIKSIIGKDLITDDNIAVLELVKNSFDAGSKIVEIVFKNLLENDDPDSLLKPSNDTSLLVIKDTGIGMSEYDLTQKWLNIAYSEKKEIKEEYGRVLAGNKGVGRFSCDRLGRFLTIYSRKKNEDYNKLFIDWQVFEKEGDIDFNIQDIEFEIQKLDETRFIKETGYSGFKSGTILEIANLREYWHSNKILKLKRQLEKLINPNQAFKANSFGIKLYASDFIQYDKDQEDYNKINGEVKNKIFEKLDFRTTSVEASIDSKGEYITTTLKDRGRDIFVLKERNPFSQLLNISTSIYYLNTYSKIYFARQTGIKSVNFGSISLFINGFRIPPYGDEGDDWLGMEIRKGQGHSRYLGTREVVGRIEINDENEKFKIISSRAGVVNNVAFEQLTRSKQQYGFYYKIFRRLERFVVEGIKWDSVPNEKHLEEQILKSNNWDEDKEVFNEDSLTRNSRVLAVIGNIIDIKKDEIVDLKINDELVKEIVNNHIEKTKKELEEIVKAVEEKSKELTPEVLTGIIDKISHSSGDIGSFSKIISDKYSDTSKIGFNEINKLQQTLQVKHSELSELKNKLWQEAEARNKAERDLELEREKNTYLRTSSKDLSQDAKGLVHNIKITSKKISDSIDNLYDKILNDNYTKKQLLKSLGAIKFQSEKALKISKIITRSNFKTDKTAQIVDVTKYIHQYIDIYSDIYSSSIDFEVIDNNTSLIRKISLLEISVIIDDLISNSEKAEATKIQFELSNPTTDSLKIYFSDNGNGVPDEFLDTKEKIFELGITTTKGGSGIGLNSIRSGLKSMKGEIHFIGNNIKLSGACFEIIFK